MSDGEAAIPLADLRRQHVLLRTQIDAAIGRVLDRCDFIRGEALVRFEEAFAAYVGVKHAVGVGSGTDALYLALAGAGVGQGDEVITAANSFAATAEAVVMTGAVPVFADVDDETLCLDPASVERTLSPRTRAVIPVHLHGVAAPMEGILEIARQRGLLVIEDAAQAHGTRRGDRLAGSFGDAGCFSFFPSKNLGGAGDGGMVTTDRDSVAAQVRMIRDHGRTGSHQHAVVGQCSRLDTLQAAVLEVKLPHLEGWNVRRRELARRYNRLLAGVEGLRLPPYSEEMVFHHYVVRTDRRDGLKDHLAGAGIATGIHYLRSIPEEPAFASFRTIPTPVADRSCHEVLSLPLFPEMRDEEADRVCEAVRGFFSSLA